MTSYVVYLEPFSLLVLQSQQFVRKLWQNLMKLIGYYRSFIPFFPPNVMYIFSSQGFCFWKGHEVICMVRTVLFKTFDILCVSCIMIEVEQNPHK